MKRALAAVEEYKEKLKIAESRLRVQETGGRREQGQTVIEKEAYSAKLRRLNTRLETTEEEARELRATNQRLAADQAVQREEVVQAEKLIASLKEELSYLRDHSLTELSENHKGQLDYLKKELTELQKPDDESATLKPKTKPSQLNLKRTRRSRLSQSRSRRQSNKGLEGSEEGAEIERLQETIAALNQQYRRLLETSSSVDLQTLRLELNSIAQTLEENTSQLIRLKRKQRAE
jgi:hypothetical protein